ncbi:MAG: fumarylacetoacetate hydrolase family protein [Desulfotomaculum sp.]|nr:fumarylacetoacetate hydrolase family protein [Desulfotomaculum sp.]
MRTGRFLDQERIFTGQLADDGLVYPLVGDIYGQFQLAEQDYSLEKLQILAPCQPSKIICVGLNYRDHAQEFGLPVPEEPLLFMKPSTAVIGTGQPVILPPQSKQVDYEGELAVVIKRCAKNITSAEAPAYILGYTCANDVTARDLQKKDGQWVRAKSFDTFCPLGPYIVSDIEPGNLTVAVYQNNILKQHTSTGNFIFEVPVLVSFISRIMTLLPGDVILTGTSSGVGAMTVGDEIKIKIENIGDLVNPVI